MTVAGKYLTIFVDEGRDLIKRIGTRFVRLEEAPDDVGALESALRMLHTLKGSAKMVGLDNVSRAAHSIETVFKEASVGGPMPSSDEVSRFFSLLDRMDQILDMVANGRAEEAQRLELAAAPRPAVPEKSKTARGAGEPLPPSAPARAPDDAPTVQTRPPPADGLRVKVTRIDKLQEQIEDMIVQKWQIFAGLKSLQSHFGSTGSLDRHIKKRPGAANRDSSFSVRDMLAFSEEVYRMAAILSEMQVSVMELRMVPLADLFEEYRRMVRDLALSLGKDVVLRIDGESTEVDRNLLEGLQGPLTHLLRNAVDHGVESPERRAAVGKDQRATITLRAYQKPGRVVVEVEDDGRGLDPDQIRATAVEKGFLNPAEASALSDTDAFYLLCRSGFTTRESADEVSGRGVGLDAVKVRLDRLRGTLAISSVSGEGTTFRMFLPQSLSNIKALVAKSEGIHAAFPTLFVEKCIGVSLAELSAHDGMIDYEGEKLTPVSLAALFGREPKPPTAGMHVIVIAFRKRRMAIAVERIEREQDLVVKNLGQHLQQSSSVLGVSLLADGTPAPILDIPELHSRWPGLELSAALPAPKVKRRLRVLVVDDAVTSRHVESTILETLGHEVEQAGDGLQAIRLLERKPFDLVVTDLEMPHVDGIELTREIRRDERLSRLPIIMVTGVGEDEVMDRSYEAGVNAFLTKDRLSRQVLARAIRKLFPA